MIEPVTAFERYHCESDVEPFKPTDLFYETVAMILSTLQEQHPIPQALPL